jgi:hypothetical protein
MIEDLANHSLTLFFLLFLSSFHKLLLTKYGIVVSLSWGHFLSRGEKGRICTSFFRNQNSRGRVESIAAFDEIASWERTLLIGSFAQQSRPSV